MNKKTQARCEARAEILKALSHPARLYIVEELSKGERCVCELQLGIGSDMSTVSKHLSVLKSAGVVRVDKRGTQVFYSLRLQCVQGFLRCAESAVREDAKRQLEAIG